MILVGYLFSLFYSAVVLLLGVVMQRFGVEKTYTRKLVHILVGFEWFILSYFHQNTVHFLFVCVFFLALLSLIYRKGWLSMMSSEGDNAPGTVYYAFSMSVLAGVSVFLPEMMLPFGVGVLVTSLGDGFAGVFGSAIPKKIYLYKSKTLFGSVAAFVFSFVSVFLFSRAYALELGLWDCLAISLFATGLELICTRGFDNIVLPIGTAFFSYLLLYVDSFSAIAIPLSLAPLLFAITVAKKKLTFWGALTAVILEILVVLSFGSEGFALLIAYFVLALASDSVKIINKKAHKSECRGASQVLANSFLAMLASLSYFIFSHKFFLFIYVLVFTESLADTAASGFGVLSRKTYDPFRFREVEKGSSGGVSLIGTLAALFFSFSLAALGGLLFSLQIEVVMSIALCAMLGVVIDSALGSLVQMKYKCEVCQKTVEEPYHCGVPTQRTQGIYPFDNSFVNFISSVLTVALFFIIFVLT